MNNKGWVAIHRSLLDNPIAEKPTYLSVWVHLLLMANHKKTHFIWNGKKQSLKSGQLITGRKKLSKNTGVPEGTIYRILKYLENEQQIEQQTYPKFTIITILNWQKYQDKNNKVNNKRTTDEQQMNTYNNDNNDNNDNKRGSLSLLREKETWVELSEKFGVSTTYVKGECEKMIDWLKANGKRQKDYKAFARNWIRKGLESGGEAKVNSRKHENYWKKKKEEEKKRYAGMDSDNYYIEDADGNKITLAELNKK